MPPDPYDSSGLLLFCKICGVVVVLSFVFRWLKQKAQLQPEPDGTTNSPSASADEVREAMYSALSDLALSPITTEHDGVKLHRKFTPVEIADVVEDVAHRFGRRIDRSVYDDAVTISELVNRVAAHLSGVAK